MFLSGKDRVVSVVKQWNGIKDTGNDKEWQKCRNDWSQSKIDNAFYVLSF